MTTMKPKLALARPSTTAKKPTTSETARAAAKMEDGDARLVVNLPERAHRAIKLRAVERGITIREYVIRLLEGDGLEVR